MSRGPGKLQVKIMETLKQYHDLGESLEWRFDPGGSWMAQYADKCDIEAYERGDRVECWKLRRDLEISKSALSRALRGLERMEYIFRYGPDLGIPDDRLGIGENTKYSALTLDGKKYLEKHNKRQQNKNDKVDA